MMISAAPPEARQSQQSPQPTNCSPIREQRGLPIEIRRMVGLETAFEILGGKGQLAGVLGITVRALNYKLNADRGVSNLDLTWTAKALEARGNKMLEHAAKLRAVLADGTVPMVCGYCRAEIAGGVAVMHEHIRVSHNGTGKPCEPVQLEDIG
jgi:hypothetical protein